MEAGTGRDAEVPQSHPRCSSTNLNWMDFFLLCVLEQNMMRIFFCCLFLPDPCMVFCQMHKSLTFLYVHDLFFYLFLFWSWSRSVPVLDLGFGSEFFLLTNHFLCLVLARILLPSIEALDLPPLARILELLFLVRDVF